MATMTIRSEAICLRNRLVLKELSLLISPFDKNSIVEIQFMYHKCHSL